VAILAVPLVVACGGSAPPEEAPAPPASAVVAVDPATAGTIRGTITLAGTPPQPQPVNTRTDPNCVDPVTTEDVVAGSGSTLQNVFVYVKDGLGNARFAVPATPVVLEQRGCMYRPRVLGIQAGQTLEILNSDATLHNIHAVPAQNAEFNKAQQTKGFVSTHVFSTPEVMVPFRCDVHKWMAAYVGVLDHPFFAVSGADGSFEIKGLPPGTYTVEAVHEKLGRQSTTVTLGTRGTGDAGFSFTI
jgi:plastocyanin